MQLTPEIAMVGSGQLGISDPIDCNVYAIDSPEGIVLVDSGVGLGTEQIVENTHQAFQKDLDSVLLTHSHSDHSQGCPDLQRLGVTIISSEATAALVESGSNRELGLDRAKRDGFYPEEYEFTHFIPDRTFKAPAVVHAAGREFEALKVKGHARDHSCYFTTIDGRTVCFVADAVLSDGSICLLNMPGSSLQDYRSDIGLLMERDIDILLPGHGMPLLADGHDAIETAADALEGIESPPSFT